VRDGRRYYTNGNLWLRIPAPGIENSTDMGLPEEPPRMFQGVRWKVADFAPWPKAEYAIRRLDCIACVSTMDFASSLCPVCGGDGEVMLGAFQRVCGRFIRPVYHAWIAELPAVEYMVEGGDCDWLAFRFTGGEGVVKPIYADEYVRLDEEIIPPGIVVED
jgi:hypothetical protein